MILTVLLEVFRDINRRNIGLISAGVAFFSMFALFPALGAVIALWSMVSDPVVVTQQLQAVETIVPQDVYRLLNAQITALVSSGPVKLGWASILSLLLALWSARTGVGALMRGLNTVYGAENRSGLRHYFTALLLTGALVLMSLLALSIVVVAPIILAFIPLGGSTAVLIQVVRWGAMGALLLYGLGALYRYGPNHRGSRRPKWLTVGSVLVVFLWVAASVALSYYLSNFGAYNQVYGSIGAVAGMMFWLFLSSYLVLLGACVNARLKDQMEEI